MPVHDWSRVNDGIFHDFHTSWIPELRRVFNSGLLPPDYYALAEQIAGGIGPDVITLSSPSSESNGHSLSEDGAVAVATAPPKVRVTVRAEIDEYALKQRTLVIRHVSKHRIVALVEIFSPGIKSSRNALRALLEKARSALAQRIHLLLIDLHPPTPRDPRGIHDALWKEIVGDQFDPPANKPLTLAAYVAAPVKTAYVEPIAVGDTLPDMPLFLTPEMYVNVPLERTYQLAYEPVPRFYREILEGRS